MSDFLKILYVDADIVRLPAVIVVGLLGLPMMIPFLGTQFENSIAEVRFFMSVSLLFP